MTRNTDRPTLNMFDSAYLDRSSYRAIHFFGETLPIAFREAATYLERLECYFETPPCVASAYGTFSEDNADSELAWKVTLIVNDGDGAIDYL